MHSKHTHVQNYNLEIVFKSIFHVSLFLELSLKKKIEKQESQPNVNVPLLVLWHLKSMPVRKSSKIY